MESTSNPARVAAEKCSASSTLRTRRIIVRHARQAESCWPTALSPAFCARIGRRLLTISQAVRTDSVQACSFHVRSPPTNKESSMLTLEITNCCTTPPQVCNTLWHCSRCDAFVSIHSVRPPDGIHCPACGEVLLDFCGRLSSIPGIQFGDA